MQTIVYLITGMQLKIYLKLGQMHLLSCWWRHYVTLYHTSIAKSGLHVSIIRPLLFFSQHIELLIVAMTIISAFSTNKQKKK